MLQHQRLTFQHVSNLHRTSLVFIEVFFFLFFSERASPVPFFPATLFFLLLVAVVDQHHFKLVSN